VCLLADFVPLLAGEFIGRKALALAGSICVLCKFLTETHKPGYTAEKCLREVERHTDYPFRDPVHSTEARFALTRFSDLFEPITSQILMELFSAILNPYLFIVILPSKASEIVNFIANNSVNETDPGRMCEFSLVNGNTPAPDQQYEPLIDLAEKRFPVPDESMPEA
jgi:hypothetical protein